jgi:nucleotide-binding universal stress UspA family protein
MYNTILVPLDGSKRAEMILPHVEELARHYQARVIFLRVVEQPPLIAGSKETHRVHWDLQQKEQEKLTHEAESYLSSLQGEFREKGIDAGAHVVHGPTVKEIMNAAEREDADLIAIASHGRGGLSRVFYGSVAAGVLHRADRPLLLIRALSD